jgi:hypothetical protein
LAKQEKLASNSLSNQLGKNRNLAIADVSFQEVEGHKQNFVSLKISDVN